MKIILMRHGEICPSGLEKRYIGQEDYPMTEEGKQTVRQSLQALQREFPSLSLICCSDLKRCVQTAEIACELYGLPWRQDRRLREICLGVWEGMTMRAVRERFPEEYRRRGESPELFRPPEGENFWQLARRALDALHFWLGEAKQPDPMLVITHAGVIKALQSLTENHSLQQVFACRVDYGAYYVMDHLPEL